jgi:hypothetical protein
MSNSNEVEVERTKHQIDYVKHMTTLSTGSILLLATFLEKLFSKPNWKILIPISFSGFIVSTIASIIAHTVLVLSDEFGGEGTKGEKTLVALSLVLMWVSFLVGVICLGIFSIRNFL